MIFAVPIILGAAVVIQGILNLKIGKAIGLLTAVLVNALVFFVLSGILFLLSYLRPQFFPLILRPPSSPLKGLLMTGEPSAWMYGIPGFCGFLLVLGVPFAIHSLGPSRTFVILISAQIAFSVIFELAVQSNLNPWKFVGASLAMAGAYMVATN